MNYAIKNNVNHGREKDKWNYMHTGVDRFCKSLRTTAETQGIVLKVSLDLYWIFNSKCITNPSLIYKCYQDGRYRRRHSLCPSKG